MLQIKTYLNYLLYAYLNRNNSKHRNQWEINTKEILFHINGQEVCVTLRDWLDIFFAYILLFNVSSAAGQLSPSSILLMWLVVVFFNKVVCDVFCFLRYLLLS